MKMVLLRRRHVCLFSLVIVATLACAQQGTREHKQIPISIAVEAEGPNGMWSQSSTDLSKVQLQELENLLKGELSKAPDHKIVDMNDSSNHFHIAVVAARLERAGGRNWFIASSAITPCKNRRRRRTGNA